ncbi:hypothetical protein ID866_11669 [Astraeus odoratus]|nr:hypothetical protein ID866_11669 [Astraeus odoratus]
MIVVMGPTGAGKSSFIRNAVPSNFQSDIQIGHGLESETSKIRPISYRMSDGTHINIVDTPGFDDSHEGINDVQVLEMIATFLADGYKKRTYDLVGILYFHRISDTRVGGTTKRNLRMFQKICGTKALENVVIVTTMWDKVTAEEGSAREEELLKSEDLFKPLIDGKAVLKRYNAIRQPKTAVEIVDDFRNKNVVTTQIVHELVHQKKALADTEAGAELQKEVQALLEKRMKEIQELEAEIQRAVEEKDKKTVEMVLTEKQAVQEDITKLHGQLKRLVCGKVAFQRARSSNGRGRSTPTAAQ